jgi:chromate transporter
MIYLELFLTFLKIGAFTFGGGYAMLPLIQSETVARGWIGAEALMDFVAVAESTPGPFAINIATYIGAETGGILGAACATLGVVLPSFIIILIVARVYTAFRRSRLVEGLMTGLRPTVLGLIASAALSMALTVFFPAGLALSLSPALFVSLAIFAAALFAVLKLKTHPIIVILAAAALGVGCGYLGVWG